MPPHPDGLILLPKVADEVDYSEIGFDNAHEYDAFINHVNGILSARPVSVLYALAENLPDGDAGRIRSACATIPGTHNKYPSQRTQFLRGFVDILRRIPHARILVCRNNIQAHLQGGGRLDQLLEGQNAIPMIDHMFDLIRWHNGRHHLVLLVDIIGRKIEHDLNNNNAAAAQNNRVDNDDPVVAAEMIEGLGNLPHINAQNDEALEEEVVAAEEEDDNDDAAEFNNDMIPFDGNNHMISVDDDDDDDLSHNDNNREGESDDDDADNSNGEDEGAVEEDQQSTTTVHEFWDLDEFSDVFESNEGLEDAVYELFKGDNINDQDQVRELFEEFNAVSNSDISLETFFWHLKIMKEMKALESAVENAEETARDAEEAARDAEERAQRAEERAQRAEERAQRAERKAKDAKELADLHKLGEELAKKKLALAEESAQDWEKCGEGILRELRVSNPICVLLDSNGFTLFPN